RSIIDEYVLSERARGRAIFDSAFVEQLVARHQSGTEDHSERLWALVNFEIWMRQFLDGENNQEEQRLSVEVAAV
ncbi:MAG TPA: asparagine synthase-related protein, partial [Pyrinomonadaceae bacterium]|nr:asparagine synthase-related protein [Pyrinomonadaceae bacterium]